MDTWLCLVPSMGCQITLCRMLLDVSVLPNKNYLTNIIYENIWWVIFLWLLSNTVVYILRVENVRFCWLFDHQCQNIDRHYMYCKLYSHDVLLKEIYMISLLLVTLQHDVLLKEIYMISLLLVTLQHDVLLKEIYETLINLKFINI
jgi:hypothetical protein